MSQESKYNTTGDYEIFLTFLVFSENFMIQLFLLIIRFWSELWEWEEFEGFVPRQCMSHVTSGPIQTKLSHLPAVSKENFHNWISKNREKSRQPPYFVQNLSGQFFMGTSVWARVVGFMVKADNLASITWMSSKFYTFPHEKMKWLRSWESNLPISITT